MRTITSFALLLIGAYSYGTDAIRLKISGTTYSDETIVRFIDGAANGFDNSYDATKLLSPNKQVPAIYTMVDTLHKLGVNSYPLLENAGVKTDVFIRNYVAATYTISCEEFGAISPDACIYMEDIKTGLFYDLRAGGSYIFQLSADSLSHHPRLAIHFTIPSTYNTTAASCNMSNNGSVSISKPGSDVWNYQLFNSLGQTVKADSNINSATTIPNLFPGNYNLVVYTKYGCIENLSVTVSSTDSLKASFISSADTIHLSSATIHLSNQSVKAEKYVWEFGDLNTDSLSINPVHTYSAAGVYTVKLTAKNGACSNTTQQLIHVLPTPGITTGINQENNSNKIKIYNSLDGIMISMNNNLSNENYNVSIYTTLGQLVYNNKIESSDNNYLIPYFNSSETILIVQVSNNRELFSQRIVVGK